MTLTKADIVEQLITELGLGKKDAKDFVDMFFECVRETLVSGKSVRLSKFGKFNLRDKPSRPGRNPRNGQAFEVSARRVVTFRAGLKLRRFVAEKGLPPS